MMRLVITLFLSAFFLLLRGGDHLYARVNHHPHCYSPANLPNKLKGISLGTEKSAQSFIDKSTPSDTENDTFDATEFEDDDESVSARKYIELSNYFVTFFCAPDSRPLHTFHRNRLPFCEHLSYQSSYKYIIQRVIRI